MEQAASHVRWGTLPGCMEKPREKRTKTKYSSLGPAPWTFCPRAHVQQKQIEDPRAKGLCLTSPGAREDSSTQRALWWMRWLWGLFRDREPHVDAAQLHPTPTLRPVPLIELLALSPKPSFYTQSWNAGAGTVPAVSMALSIGALRECKTRLGRNNFLLSACYSFLPASPHKSPLLWQKLLIPVATGSSFQVFPHSQNQPHHGPSSMSTPTTGMPSSGSGSPFLGSNNLYLTSHS